MKRAIRFRHNMIKMNAIATFANLKGGYNQGCRDVYFVRALGMNGQTVNEIHTMDKKMEQAASEGKLFYCRVRGLSYPTTEEAAFYAGHYSDWCHAGYAVMQTKVQGLGEDFAYALGDACLCAVNMYAAGKNGISESIKKNFVIKLLYWLDTMMAGFLTKWDVRCCIKVVAENVVKEQEYLFYYMLTLLGCDVLLLQNRADIATRQELDSLSQKFVLGSYQDCQLPAWTPLCGQEQNQLSADTASGWQTGAVLVAGAALSQRTGASAAVSCQRTGAASADAALGRQTGASAAASCQRTDASAGMQKEKPRPVCVVPKKQAKKQRDAYAPPDTRTKGTISQSTHTPEGRMQAATREEKSFEQLALLAASVVMITVYDQTGNPKSTGSGIMVGKAGYILTNCHVAAGGKYYSVRIENDETIYKTDEMVKYNPVLDLAMIRIDRTLNPIPLYHGPEKLVRGQKVVAIGSPLGLFNSVSDGIISGFRNIDNVDMIQFTAPISHGSSGGAVLNMFGEVIGISTAGFDDGQNINLAVSYESIHLFARGFV